MDKNPCHPARPLVSVVAVKGFDGRKAQHEGKRFKMVTSSLSWNLVISAPCTADNPRAIFNHASTNFIAAWPN